MIQVAISFLGLTYYSHVSKSSRSVLLLIVDICCFVSGGICTFMYKTAVCEKNGYLHLE